MPPVSAACVCYSQSEVSYDYPRDAFNVSAAASYSTDQQVYISYGTQNNDSLLQMYGFVEQDNPHDIYVMTSLLKWLEQLQPPCQERLDALNRAGLLQALQNVVLTRKGFGGDTLQALRFLLVPGSSGSSDQQGAGSTQGLPAGAPGSFSSPADAATEQKLGLVLVHACQQELSVLGAPPAGQQAAAAAAAGGKGKKGSSSGSNGSSVPAAVAAASAAAFRVEKRKVLMACLEQLTGETSAGAAVSAAGAEAADQDAGVQAATASKR